MLKLRRRFKGLKKFLVVAIQAALLAELIVLPVYAQSESQIVNGINEVLRKVVLVIGPAVLGFGLIRGFAAHSSGDEEGMRTARNAVIGGLGVLFTFTIVKLVVQASGVAL